MPRSFPLVALVILDGWGCAPAGPGNAVELADTPVFDRLWREFPHTTLEASGEAAGLPPGQMGNSEVGHLTIGAGRRLYQDLMRVNKAIEDGSFFENPVLRAAFERGNRVHLLGLVSHGGVHSHIDHVKALLRFAPEKTWIHAFTDGRDVSPTSAVRDLAELPLDRIATVVGRYYAMDRDQRLERTQKAFDAIVHGRDAARLQPTDLLAGVQASYDAGITDEFIEPICVEGAPRVEPGRHGDLLQLPAGSRPPADAHAARPRRRRHDDDALLVRPRHADRVLGAGHREHARRGARRARRRQLHVAETEKYAHVTYFFNGGREDEWPGETRMLVPSPRDVPSYDFKPEMSADEVRGQGGRAGRRRLRLLRRQLCEPRHGRPHRARSRRSSKRCRRPTAASAGSSSA